MNFIKKIIDIIKPPENWKLAVLLSSAVLIGLFFLIFHISNASSYLSNNPNTCINCHVMSPQFASWQKSSHARVATCNDCHVPHGNVVNTLFVKASDGMRHATVFTFRNEPQVIRIKNPGKLVVQENCIRCHLSRTDQTHLNRISETKALEGRDFFCWDCHRETPHSKISSLSSFPDAIIPASNRIIPEWMEKQFNLKK